MSDACDLQAVANRDLVQLRERPGQDDLVVGDWPATRRDVEDLDRAARVVTTNRVHVELSIAKSELDVAGGVWTAVRRGTYGRGGSLDQLWIGVRSECHLQVRAPLLLERDLIWVTRLRHEGHGCGPRGHGKENGQKDHRRLQPAPAQVGQRLDENGSHRDASSLRTRITSEAARSGLSSRASSTIFPSMTLITRAA